MAAGRLALMGSSPPAGDKACWVWPMAKQKRKQLIRRFRPLPAWTEAKLAGAEPAQLEAWAERVLDAAMLEEVFAEE